MRSISRKEAMRSIYGGKNMKIVFGCDPNAAEFKEELMEYVKELGHEVTDFGSEDPIYANVAIKMCPGGSCKRI